jgi:hypothetical protein
VEKSRPKSGWDFTTFPQALLIYVFKGIRKKAKKEKQT